MGSKLMRWFLCCLFLGLASPAAAQTVFSIGDCNAGISITGGLTLTSTNAGNFVGCRASVGKQSGKLYYTATVNHAPVATVWGVAGGGAGTDANFLSRAWATTSGFVSGNNYMAAVLRADGSAYWNNTATTAGASVISGKTIVVALNLDTDPGQIWVTSDLAGASGYGGGPLWNGSNISSPLLPGTGQAIGVFPAGATAGTGKGFYIPGMAVWPIWQGQVLDSSTFSFAANTTVDALLASSGYLPWNNSSGNLAYPGPQNPLQINVSNAPGWQATHAYLSPASFTATGSGTNLTVSAVTGFLAAGATISSYDGTIPASTTIVSQTSGTTGGAGVYVTNNATTIAGAAAYAIGDRFNAGAGWSGSAYTSGLPVCVFAVINGGQGTSGASASAFNTACASGTPSGTGGIPGGSWPGATTVTSGGVTAALLKRIDYATLTDAFNDSATNWAPSTAYPGIGYVRNGGNLYLQQQLFNPPATCVSGSGSGPPSADGTCHWVFTGALTYSSNANIWPTMHYYGSDSIQFNYNVQITIWYGGSAQQIYGPQQPGEMAPTLMAYHQDLPNDQDFYCFHGYGIADRNSGCSWWSFSLTVAPGDSFKDNSTSSTPLRIDQTKGVTVINTAAYGSGSSAYSVTGGEPIAFSDNYVAVDRMQLLSSHGIVVGAHALFGPGNQHTNNLQITNSIVDSGGGTTTPGAYFCDGGCNLNNYVLIAGSTVSGSIGARFQYQNGLVANGVIVGTGATNSTCIYNSAYFGSFPTDLAGNFYNNLCVGFSFPWAHITGSSWPGATPGASNNAITSPAGGYGGSFTDALGQTSTSFQLPGVNTATGCGAGQASPCSGLTGANQLVNPTIGGSFDARIKTGADVIGAGVNYSVAGALFTQATTTPTNDIIGQAWPPRWDIGAEKFAGPAPAASVIRLCFGRRRC